MPKQLSAKVYVDKAVYAIDMPFDYLVPETFAQTLRRGCRVLVPFGGANRKVQGLVASIGEQTEFDRGLKTVLAQLDREPLISEELFAIIEYLVRNTFCTYYEAVRAVVPVGANVDVTEYYELLRRVDGEELEALSQGERRLVEFLRTARTTRELNRFLDCRQNPAKSAVVRSLAEKGIIGRSDRIKPRIAAKTVRMVRLSGEYEFERTPLPPKQKKVVALLREVGAAFPKELAYLCGVTEAVVRTLVKKGALVSFERAIEPGASPRRLSAERAAPEPLELSEEQQAAYEGILALSEDGGPHAALLHGITGSGKTQIYVKLIETMLSRGKTALLLVPEIALTPQLVEKFERVFGSVVAVIHSSLSVTERLDEYNRIRAGKVSIVIGTRSAVFAPLGQIGIVILDEEGEASYKSEAAPRYHARDVAKLRCVRHNATLLLGSATPSIDSYYRAKRGDYALFELHERYAAANLPQVYLIDMLAEQRQHNPSPLSGLLAEQLAQNLAAGEQSILLINRRGYHTIASCMECGEVLKCPSCSVAMTYHRANGSLMCHHCGHVEPFCSRCPACGGEYIKLTGTGTQKLEDETARRFPEARILRMDADTTYSKTAFERSFDDFRQGKYDILLGTQMIAKGLDFPNVTLVGVVNADGGLYSGDYRSSERVFSLITQVVGRSGRSEKPGRAYLQTLDTGSPILNYAANQDYPAFYEDEIAVRKALLYPPFCDLVLFGTAGPDEAAAERAACRALELLYGEAQAAAANGRLVMKALGVMPAPIYKVAGKYRWRIVVKCRLNERMKAVVSATLKKCGKDPLCAGVTLYADANGELN